MSHFGLIGKGLSHSFSKDYFTQFFLENNLPYQYHNFDFNKIDDFEVLSKQYFPLIGCNVTIPYKSAIIPFIDSLDYQASKVGAVNCLHFTKQGCKGFNTDIYGFEKSLFNQFLPKNFDNKAIILGDGGAAKAAAYVLHLNKIPFVVVCRNLKLSDSLLYAEKCIRWQDISSNIWSAYNLIINATPIGMKNFYTSVFPVSFDGIDSDSYCYDMIYNPEITPFLREAKLRGAKVKNGMEMLNTQAFHAWEIWNS